MRIPFSFLDDTGVISDLDEPLSMRHLRRRSSSVSGASNDEGSHSYSNDSFTTGTSAEENSDESMRGTTKPDADLLSSSATIVNLQRPSMITPTPPMAFNIQSPQKVFTQVQPAQPQTVKPQTVNKRQEKRTKRRRGPMSASTFYGKFYFCLRFRKLGSLS